MESMNRGFAFDSDQNNATVAPTFGILQSGLVRFVFEDIAGERYRSAQMGLALVTSERDINFRDINS